ncbi:MAG: cytochrome-c peroxidase [Chlorobiota bacterium]
MKKMSIIASIVLFVIILAACGDEKDAKLQVKDSDKKDELLERAQGLFAVLPAKAENPENPLTQEKIALGKKLYFDTALSMDGNNSCNSCHNLETYGVDNLKTSPGDKGEFGNRNSPTVLNAAFHTTQFWDGRAKDVEEQATGPIVNPVEMAMPSPEFVVKRLSENEEYRTAFAEVFPEEKITIKNVGKAIAAFERTLITPSRFDDYLAGEATALTDKEKEGLKTFMDTGCITCHNGSQLGGNMFQKFGVHKPYWEATGSEVVDEGRFEVTGNESDKYMFKVPGLRNIEKTWPYFHDGSVESLDEAVAIMADVQLNKQLTDEEIDNITAFLKTLTGEVSEEALMSSN